MNRSYKFLLRPTCKQADALNAALAIHCEVYNAALEHRREAWKRARVSVSWIDQCRELTEVRKIRPDVAAVNAQSLQQTLRRLNQAFDSFFRRVKAGERPGYPRFRSVRRFDTITFPQPREDGSLLGGRIYVPGVGWVKVHQHRPIPNGARVKQVSVRREGRRWNVMLLCEGIPGRPAPPTGAVVGVDLGVANFLTTSDAVHISNPRHFATLAGQLAAAQQVVAQQVVARKRRGSGQRRRAVAEVAALHAKAHRSRLDHAHKTALQLVRDHDVIVHEALKISNMTRRPVPRPAGDGTYEPNRASAKAGLNRSILDAGWGMFLRVLAGKAEEAARTVIAVNPCHTSQRCSQCGHVAAGNRVSQAEFRCQSCGHEAHADVNAAINILRAGLALREAS